MEINDIYISLINRIIDNLIRSEGYEKTYKIVNAIDGLKLYPNGDITLLKQGHQLLPELIKSFETEVKGKITFDWASLKIGVRRISS